MPAAGQFEAMFEWIPASLGCRLACAGQWARRSSCRAWPTGVRFSSASTIRSLGKVGNRTSGPSTISWRLVGRGKLRIEMVKVGRSQGRPGQRQATALTLPTLRIDCVRRAPDLRRPLGRGVAQPGSASALGAEGRRFESCLPDHQSSSSTNGSSRIRRSAAMSTRPPTIATSP